MKHILLPAALLALVAAAPAHAQQTPAAKTAGDTANEILDEARKDQSGRPTSEVARDIAVERTREKLANASGLEKKAVAVGTYLGFEMINTEGREGWCKERGVDLTPFVSTFRAAHAEHRRHAVRILGELDIDEKMVAAEMRPGLQAPLEQDMADMMKVSGRDGAGLCRLLNENAEALVKALTLPAEVEAALKE